MRGVPVGEDLVHQVGAAAVGAGPGEGGADQAAAEEEGLAVAGDAGGGAVGLAARRDLQAGPVREGRDRLAARGVLRAPGVEAGDERAVVARGEEGPARPHLRLAALARWPESGTGGGDTRGEVAVADVGVGRGLRAAAGRRGPAGGGGAPGPGGGLGRAGSGGGRRGMSGGQEGRREERGRRQAGRAGDPHPGDDAGPARAAGVGAAVVPTDGERRAGGPSGVPAFGHQDAEKA